MYQQFTFVIELYVTAVLINISFLNVQLKQGKHEMIKTLQ